MVPVSQTGWFAVTRGAPTAGRAAPADVADVGCSKPAVETPCRDVGDDEIDSLKSGPVKPVLRPELLAEAFTCGSVFSATDSNSFRSC